MLPIKLLHTLILIYCLVFKTEALFSISLPIGGIFNAKTDNNSLNAFKNIVTAKDAYDGEALYLEVLDSYSTALDVCKVDAAIAIIDARPTNGVCDVVCLLCNQLNIAHLSVGWQIPDSLPNYPYTFSYHPHPETTSKAFAALIRFLQWDKFTILYENDDSFIRLQEVINTWPQDRDPIIYRKLEPDGDNRETFKHIFKVARMSSHILDCDAKNVKKYMKEIIQIENSTQYQSFILTALDAYTIKLDDVPDLMANVSTLHLTKLDDIGWKDIRMDGNSISFETALTADALHHLEMALRLMINEDEGDTHRITERYKDVPKLCLRDNTAEYKVSAWSSGDKLREALINTKINGFSGYIEFDETGKRTNFDISYSKLNNESMFVYAGYWSSKTDVIISENSISDRSSAHRSDSVIRVASIKGEPYFMVDDENGTVSYRGYAMDLIDLIFKQINKVNKTDYRYEFYRVPGDKYGNPIAGSRKWDGLIGDLIEHKADLGICDLTITAERNAVVDFSIPFKTLGISMLFREPEKVAPDMFSFMKPLSLDVWLYLATSYIIVSFILLICARSSQGDWVNPHPCNQNPENLQNIWTLYNCMWLTMGSIMTQGCDILPRAAVSRWITGVWWFFALIITSSYTANMSTFVSDSRRDTEIKSVKELAEQNKVTYGAVYNASTYKFFEKSNDSIYMKIWSTMNSAKPTVFTHNNVEGRDRVLKSKGKYAFFMESTAIEYYTHRYCDLKMVGSKLDSKDYGIAIPKRSPLKGLVDAAILNLQETGVLENLHKQWWNDNTSHCAEMKKGDDSGSLQMENTSGIFLVLGVGGILGFFVSIIDFMLHANKIAVKEKVSFREALSSEWKASFNLRALQKSAAPPRSAPPSTSPSPNRERSKSRAVSVLRAASSFINFDEIY